MLRWATHRASAACRRPRGAIGEDNVSAETRDLARSLLVPRHCPAPEQPGRRIMPNDHVR
jgi:hypothetical protein